MLQVGSKIANEDKLPTLSPEERNILSLSLKE